MNEIFLKFYLGFLIAIACHTWLKLITQPSFLSGVQTWLISNVKNQTLLTWAGLGCEYCFTLFWGLWLGLFYTIFQHDPIYYAVELALLAAVFSYPLTYIKNNI